MGAFESVGSHEKFLYCINFFVHFFYIYAVCIFSFYLLTCSAYKQKKSCPHPSDISVPPLDLKRNLAFQTIAKKHFALPYEPK